MAVLTVDTQKAPAGAAENSIAAYLGRNMVLVAVAVVGWFAFFWPTLRGLVDYWLEDPDFSHGFLVPLVSAGILYANRAELGAIPARGSKKGLFLLLVSAAVFFAGALSYTNILERLAAWAALVSGVVFLFGFELLARKFFPYVFLLLAIPPPFFLLSPLRLGLKGFATRVSADLLSLAGYSAFAEGNVLALGEHQLEVADACSGIRSLMAIFATAILFAYLFRAGIWKGSLLIATAVPVTVAVNVVRIIFISVALDGFDVDLTHGTSHEVVGFIVFGLSLGLLYASWRFYSWLLRWGPREADA